MVYKSSISWKKAGLSFVVGLVSVLVAGCAAVYGDNPYYLAIVPLITGAVAGLNNYLKHKE